MASRGTGTTPSPAPSRCDEVLEAHLLAEDIPLAHRGMQGRVWRAKIGAEKNKKKMEATRARLKAARASRKAAKNEKSEGKA